MKSILFVIVIAGPYVVWTCAFIRSRYVKGSYGRYVFTTIQWAATPPYFAWIIWYKFLPNTPDVLWYINTGAFFMFLWALIKDEDDNWFRKKRKQLKKYITNLLAPRRLAT